ncbi:M1 family metallopeptidase [Desulfococcus sp.]|uniref:M1 family metallopeptidase n=1 Tax=Desulfococcus sp. TaxID=2025834 RepID=UPI0035943634
MVIMVLTLGLAALSCDAKKTASENTPPTIRHDLRVRIFPSEHRLSGADTITLPSPGDRNLTFYLSERIRVAGVQVNGRAVKYRHRSGRLELFPPPGEGGGEITVAVRYDGVFDDPAPVMPVNTDNPGYGVTGTISETGVFLLGGAAWYPVDDGPGTAIRLEVEAPEGMVAVTAGRSAGIRTENGLTLSTWEIGRVTEPIALSAGPYEVREAAVGKITVATYFFPGSRHLSADYLSAVERFIRLYEDLFGPYPFEKFAVVENFFPTGYGFPSYTLLGTQVLHLPFIKETSLGHEIAHCWWGNGVGVDASLGNWSEGLTSYVSDYLYQERISAEDGRAYRRQLLRNYADIIRPENDFPLGAFTGRTDPPTKVVGYDKGAMVFHMLRREVGDDAFWNALRTLYRTYLFQTVSWAEIRTVFEEVHGRSLEPFFHQWLDRPGAAVLSLEGVTLAEENGGRLVTGTLRQAAPWYRVRVPVAVLTPAGETRVMVDMDGEKAAFAVEVPAGSGARGEDGTPEAVMVDPDADILRRLYPEEIPPSVNSLRGSDAVTAVVSERRPEEAARARLLIAALGLENADVVAEGRLTPEAVRNRDLIFMGIPRDPGLLRGVPGAAAIEGKTIVLGPEAFSLENHAVFMVFPHPVSEGRVAALFSAPDGPAEAVLRKIPHYGKYSYLAFKDEKNRQKGIWPVTESPLIHRFQIETRSYRRQP